MKEYPNRLFLAGGFIRAIIAGEKPQDIDLFLNEPLGKLEAIANTLPGLKIHISGNAITVVRPRMSIQFIHRWSYDTVDALIESFDFTIAQTVVYYDGGKFEGCCAADFYEDLAARRLVYTHPRRDEEAGGSMLRVLKFYQRGYRIPLESLSGVIARIAQKIDWAEIDKCPDDKELYLTKIISGLLREVDPNVKIDGVEMIVEQKPNEEEIK